MYETQTLGIIYNLPRQDIYVLLSLCIPRRDGLVVSMSGSHVDVCLPGHTKDHQNGTNCLPALHAGVRVGV